jgi:hypothetical protein
LETFTDLRNLAENPQYQSQKQKTLCDLNDDMIDMPIVGLINGFNELPYCFTLQSCYVKGQRNFPPPGSELFSTLGFSRG